MKCFKRSVLKINNKVVIDLDLWQKVPANIRLDEDVFCPRPRKTSSRHLQDVFIKTNVFALLIRLQKMSSRCPDEDKYTRLGHTSSRRFQDVLPRRLQNVFKTSSKRPQDALERLQDVFKTFSGHFQDVFMTFWRRLQDVFKTNHQFKLFLLTRFQDFFEIYSKRFCDVLQRRLSIEGFA